jgi:hypothetical protein
LFRRGGLIADDEATSVRDDEATRERPLTNLLTAHSARTDRRRHRGVGGVFKVARARLGRWVGVAGGDASREKFLNDHGRAVGTAEAAGHSEGARAGRAGAGCDRVGRNGFGFQGGGVPPQVGAQLGVLASGGWRDVVADGPARHVGLFKGGGGGGGFLDSDGGHGSQGQDGK